METVTVPVETFTREERERLAPHFTNLDRPVFGLVNLPETVKGAMFARYSRYPGTLRRMFLDEFADSLPEVSGIEGAEGTRAAELYERIFLGYGDDSVAQLGGAHVAMEWTSNLLTKILQRPRLAAYLEQSTRYIAYDTKLAAFGYRYHRDAPFGPGYDRARAPRRWWWPLDRVPARAARHRRRRRRAARPRRRHRPGGAVGPPAPRARDGGGAACRAPLRVVGDRRRGGAARGIPAR